MRIGIFTNLNKDIDLTVTKSVVVTLGRYPNISLYLHENLAQSFGDGFKHFNENSEIKLDILISIGGDGTILRIAKFCSKTNTPVVGINLGRLGFLADFEPKEVDLLADMIINNKFVIEKRDIIESKANNNSFLSLNEAAIVRSGAGLLSLNVNINGAFLDCYNCDGFIIATSVGSTAYSLSAGGPILSPFSEAFVLTPINSHSLYTRPIVINNKEIVDVSLQGEAGSAELIIDGVKAYTILNNEPIQIKKSLSCIEFARPLDHNFYSKMFSKFNRY